MTQCLILGPEFVGKTLLIKAIKRLHSGIEETKYATLIPQATQPTVGTNMITLPTPQGVITLKEYGGSMAPLWPKSLIDADMLIYVVDSSNNTQISAATVLLLETLSYEAVNGKLILLFFNKTDLKGPLTLDEFINIMRVRDLKMKYNDLFTMMSGSCLKEEGIKEVLEWIQKH